MSDQYRIEARRGMFALVESATGRVIELYSSESGARNGFRRRGRAVTKGRAMTVTHVSSAERSADADSGVSEHRPGLA